MRTISVKDLGFKDISRVVEFTLPDPALAGYKKTTPKITVTGILHGIVKSAASNAMVLEVGLSKYSVNEVWQEILVIVFPGDE